MTTTPTDAELEILRVLWDRGPSTVREIHEQIEPSRGVGYTTVLKLLQIMTEKGLVRRDESQRTHVYRVRQREETTQKHLLQKLISTAFAGSTEKLVMQALASQEATLNQLAEIRKMIDKLERDSK